MILLIYMRVLIFHYRLLVPWIIKFIVGAVTSREILLNITGNAVFLEQFKFDLSMINYGLYKRLIDVPGILIVCIFEQNNIRSTSILGRNQQNRKEY